uniref:Glycosyl transferase CAP10 domain-containing protein n=1 Tax=Erythrolobus madagascarensis TaxID=708628 RepID=A0A7S0XNB2_9RHOD|mmetsp:Transcript_3863/g.8504  ORF Transcript_3863/g.8504 Transcript_3863/m.8504 type:complete len:458 (+) Transcript_3863:3-1376(+)
MEFAVSCLAVVVVSFTVGALSSDALRRAGDAVLAGSFGDSHLVSEAMLSGVAAAVGLSFSKLAPGELERDALGKEAVRAQYEELARQLLLPFSESGAGIDRRLYMDVFESNACPLCVLIQVKSGAVWVYDPRNIRSRGELFHQLRLKEALYWTSRAVMMSKRLRTAKFEFVVSVGDSIVTTDRVHSYRFAKPSLPARPIFGATWCNVSSNLPFPLFFYDLMRRAFPSKLRFRRFRSLTEWDDRVLQYMTGDGTAWAQKIPRAVFRGVNRDSQLLPDRESIDAACFKVGRSRLFRIGQNNTKLFDVVVTGSCGGVKIATAASMSMFEQQAYKYQIYFDGNGFWADRLALILLSQSCPIKQVTPCKLFFEPLLTAWEHYVPFSYDMNDLVSNVRRVVQNDDEAKAIAVRSQRWAMDYLSHDAIVTFTDTLLSQYADLLILPRSWHLHRDAIRAHPVLVS